MNATSIEISGSDDIDANIVWGQRSGQRLGQTDNAEVALHSENRIEEAAPSRSRSLR